MGENCCPLAENKKSEGMAKENIRSIISVLADAAIFFTDVG